MPDDDAALHSQAARGRGPSPARTRSVPIRTCVGCRTRERAAALLRVVAENGRLVPDPRRRLPGRGAWLHPVPGCLDKAERRSAFARALRLRGKPETGAVRRWVQDQQGTGSLPVPSSEESKVDQS
ncbi:YlxR family protein [Pseudonocardia sp. C8]|uniref:YlxR family protein n=1 Tax=Pseudonocardia sp. C8 TaxID=2762759 RepID=UPI0016428325|nr:YlxR family protein [Pseudonocardia sp. C8]MBC3190822.1 YlxR family protein [Pseudonocardia sp. C8]